jgi:3-hydroxyisobutyrate dehydrogenase-like beta-hydroxyacid dehydrogenase
MNNLRVETIGFVGLGSMGLPMAEKLIEAGHTLVAYDVNPAAIERVVALGAQRGNSPADVARRAGIMISMVSTTAQATVVIAGKDGFIDGVQEGDLVISMSTIDPMEYPAMQQALAEKRVSIVDAPVTGMPVGARGRTLKCFLGGALSDCERARPILGAMCSDVYHLGRLGLGTAMKLLNSMLFQVTRIVAVEGLVLGVKAGLDLSKMVEILSGTNANSGAITSIAPRLAERNFGGDVRLEITCKDIELQSKFAKSVHVPAFMVNLAQQIYEMGRSMGLSEEDPTAIVKVYEQYAQIMVGGNSD